MAEADEGRLCPDCDGHLSPGIGMGWQGDDGRVRPWVLVCVTCSQRTGEDWTFGLDEHRRLVGRVDAFMLPDDVDF